MSLVRTYQTLICGATFSGIGMAIHQNNHHLIIESSSIVGNDFIECLNPGHNWKQTLKTQHAKELYLDMIKRNVLTEDDRVHLPAVYSLLCERIQREKLNVMFLTDIVRVEKLVDGFEVTLHNVSGFTKIAVERIIDTTSSCLSNSSMRAVPLVKRINAYIDNSQAGAPLPNLSEHRNAQVVQGRFPSEVIFKLDIAPEDNWVAARRKLNEYWLLRPQPLMDWKMTSIAGAFEVVYEKPQQFSKGWYWKPSCGHENLLQAYDSQIEQLTTKEDFQ